MPKITIDDLGLQILCEPDEKYIQVDDITDAGLRAIWPRLVADYPGFHVDFTFHNTLAPIGFLNEIGAEVADDCIEARLLQKDLIEPPAAEANLAITRIDASNYATFAALHDKANPEMYWTSTRLKKNIESGGRWDIFGIFDGETLRSYGFLRSWEIYCVHADRNDIEAHVALIAAMSKQAFEIDPNADVLFMIDVKDYVQLGAALHLGFRRAGHYISYSVTAK